MSNILDTEITYLNGVGPQRAAVLQKVLGISTFGDLLYLFPYKYINRTQVHRIADVTEDAPYVQLVAKLVGMGATGQGRNSRFTAIVDDGTGRMELVWFGGIRWIAQKLKPNATYVIYGKPARYGDRLSITHPEIDPYNPEKSEIGGIIPAYSTSESMKNAHISSKTIAQLQRTLIEKVHKHINETLPPYIIEQERLMTLPEALFNVHFPQSQVLLERALYRLKFEELFFLQLGILRRRNGRNVQTQGHVFGTVGDMFNRFYAEKLPFPLTDAQKRVIREIRADMRTGRQMNRLLQGDVGSGKTVVALMSMLIAVDNGFQACIMAPTEILANQNYESMSKMLSGLPINVGLLTGSSRKAERNALHRALEQGELHILIGTHALLEDVVQFHNLGLVVIDEQQRFGVAQRARLWDKNATSPPHVLVMTATPIPRTLAMTVYGDLEVSVIDQLPPGRKPVRTIHYTDAMRERLFGLMRQQIAEGRQVYVVYPLIRESEKMENLKDLQDGYESITRAFPPPHYVTVVVHGQMSADDKDFGMNQFASGRAHIMVATTVIEVGVNVPNATLMVIESAERFGLSQLHQLRGRVGRGADESYCVLMTSTKLSADSRRRMDTMVATNDGFRIAEVDLQLRGPGDIEGTLQSGTPFDLRLASITADAPLMQRARQTAQTVLDTDPLLQLPHHAAMATHLNTLAIKRTDFGGIS